MSDSSNVVEIRRALAGADRGIVSVDGGRPPAPPAEPGEKPCPITALGHLDGKFYFLDIVGQRREMSARALGGRHELLALFLGDSTWLRHKFPKKAQVKRTGADGTETTEEITVDFVINRVVAFLQEECRRSGLFGDHIIVRKPGVWPSDDGLPAVHCGDFVHINNEWRPAGYRRGNTVWAAAPPVTRPATPCDASVGKALFDDVQRLFNFRDPGAPIVVLGLLGTAALGAAARWRSAGFLIGRGGCGKTTLLDVIAACCPMHHYSNDTSKAGIEQSINGRAMPILLDETEKTGDTQGAARLLDLVLTASGARGTQGVRGGIDGVARKIEVVGSIVMAATATPEMRETHLGRFAIVEMLMPDEGADHHDAHAALVERARSNGPALWGRALAGFERYLAALGTFREALGEAGCAPREMDQLGAILAGWWLLTREGAPDARGAVEGVHALAGFLRTTEVVAEQSNARRLGHYLMTFAVQLDRSTAKETVSVLVRAVLRPEPMVEGVTQFTARRVLATHGIRIVAAEEENDARGRPAPRLGGGDGMWIDLGATELSRVFDQSDWQAGRWKSGLMELPSARKAKFTVRIGGASPKPVWVSLADLGIDDSG